MCVLGICVLVTARADRHIKNAFWPNLPNIMSTKFFGYVVSITTLSVVLLCISWLHLYSIFLFTLSSFLPPFLQNNTFAAAVVTDRRQSYAVFAYECGGINWGDEAVIGFKGSGSLFDSHPLSSGAATDVDCTEGEVTTLVYNLIRGHTLNGTVVKD